VSTLRARLQALWGRLQGWYAGHSRRDQRIILSVLTFAAVCLVYLYGFVPLREYRQRVSDEISEGRDQLARSARILSSADSLRSERSELEKRLKQTRTHLLPGRGGTLGAAALQERTNSLAAEKGITVQSTQVMKEEALDPYRKVSVRLTLSGELKPFAELLSGLEYDQQLAIPFVEANRRGAVPGAKGPRTIQATVEVTGFVLGEGAKGEEAKAEEAKAEEGAPVEGGEVVEAGEGSTTTSTTPEGAAANPAAAPSGPTGGPGAAPSGPTGPAPSGPTGSIPAPPGPGSTTTVAPAAAPAGVTTTTRAATAGTTSTTSPSAGLMAPLGLKKKHARAGKD
jgi:Tfp pilus assembly protein PilO